MEIIPPDLVQMTRDSCKLSHITCMNGIVPAWAKGFDQDTSVFPRLGSPVRVRNFKSLKNFWKGKL